METHEGEARRVNRLLDRPWKIRLFGGLQDFARTLVLLELLRLRRQGLPVSLPRGLLLRHDDLRLLLRDGMQLPWPDGRAHLFGLAVIALIFIF